MTSDAMNEKRGPACPHCKEFGHHGGAKVIVRMREVPGLNGGLDWRCPACTAYYRKTSPEIKEV